MGGKQNLSRGFKSSTSGSLKSLVDPPVRAVWQEDNRFDPLDTALPPVKMRTTLMKMAGREMRYPYTFGAQVRAFPYKFHWENCWFPKAWAKGIVLTAPLFAYIQYKVNGNKMHSWNE